MIKNFSPRVTILLFLLILIAGCRGPDPSGSYVWIDAPVDGLFLPDLVPVEVQGHATSSTGVERVELFVNGELWATVANPPTENNLSSFTIEWLPPGYGEYLIQAFAYNTEGDPSPVDQIRLYIGLDTPTPVVTVTPVITVTPVLPEPPTALVQFWADPDRIDAGDCTDLRWEVENAQRVIFGDVEQELEGSFQVCLCSGETYTLTVVQEDGVETQHQVNITVEGTCADNEPPPVPMQMVPAPGLVMDCKASQILNWQPVSDPSGISEYRVAVQRHSGDEIWSDVPGSVFSGITDKQLSITVQCGWTYRWRVLAVDGEDNQSPWSGWRQFVISLE